MESFETAQYFQCHSMCVTRSVRLQCGWAPGNSSCKYLFVSNYIGTGHFISICTSFGLTARVGRWYWASDNGALFQTFSSFFWLRIVHLLCIYSNILCILCLLYYIILYYTRGCPQDLRKFGDWESNHYIK